MGADRRSHGSMHEEALAAAAALRRSEAGVVEVLRNLQQRREEGADEATMRRVEEQLRALIEVSAAVAAVHRLDDVLELAAEHALSATGATSLSISRWYPETAMIRTLINVGELGRGEERRPANELYRAADFPVYRTVFDGVPQMAAVDDPACDPGQRELMLQLGKESSIGAPIRFRGAAWGELWATTGPGARRFAAEDLIFLQAIAEQIGSAIGRAELFDQIAALAYRDPLTDLANRRALDAELERVLAGHLDVPVALLMCDVDGLKMVNDQQGHAAGDQVLVRAADALRHAAARHPDSLVCRVGGDEFCVLLPAGGVGAARELAVEAAQRLRVQDPPVTMSCGAAQASDGGPSDLLRRADAAQYEAKQSGYGLFSVAQAAERARPDAAVVTAHEPATRGPRRTYRDRDARALEALVRETLGMLDGELALAPIAGRLRAVVTGFAELLRAGTWAIAFAGAGARSVKTLYTSDGEPVELGTSLLSRTAGFVVDAAAPASAADRDLLGHRDARAVVGVATPARGGTYVTVIFVQEAGPHLEPAVPMLRLLTLSAVAG